jgi:sulfopyruvate decarboxylase alpha subunit
MNPSWPQDVYRIIKAEGITQVATVPDGGLTRLLNLLEADPDVRVITLATEEEGVALVCGAWLGGARAILLMQSSGVGNTINMLSLPAECRIPFLALVTMRGGPDESNPWQVHMGQAVETVMQAMGTRIFHAAAEAEVGPAFEQAFRHAFDGGRSAAVLVSQQVIGAKKFSQAVTQ